MACYKNVRFFLLLIVTGLMVSFAVPAKATLSDSVIYDNGATPSAVYLPDNAYRSGIFSSENWQLADDFMLDGDAFLTDAHWWGVGDGDFEQDSGGGS